MFKVKCNIRHNKKSINRRSESEGEIAKKGLPVNSIDQREIYSTEGNSNQQRSKFHQVLYIQIVYLFFILETKNRSIQFR